MDNTTRGKIEVPSGRYCAEKSTAGNSREHTWTQCKFIKMINDKPTCAAFRAPVELVQHEGNKLHQKFIECYSASQIAEGAMSK